MRQFQWVCVSVPHRPSLDVVVMNLIGRLKRLVTLVSIACASSLCLAPCGAAAERVTIHIGPFQRTILVADLRNYANTGRIKNSLSGYLGFLSPLERSALRESLNTEVPIQLVALDHPLDSADGNRLLAEVSQVIERPDHKGREAMRAAIILGSQPDESLGILRILEAYPGRVLQIDGSAAIKAIFASLPQPPVDHLPMISAWKTYVTYQSIVSKRRQYKGCLFGDSISAGLGNSLGDKAYNFAIGGMSTVSLTSQLESLVSSHASCKTAIIAIGTNDAMYTLDDDTFKRNMVRVITLVRSLSPRKIHLLPAFYSTVAASHDPSMAGSIQRIDQINSLINEVAQREGVPVDAMAIQPLFAGKALQSSLTVDGVHLNEAGQAIYRQSLVHLLAVDAPSQGLTQNHR
jgi:lysophospholipase L1-like esterase